MVKVHFDQDDDLELVMALVKVFRERRMERSSQTSLPSDGGKEEEVVSPPATEKQRKLMKKLHIEFDAETITVDEASKLISAKLDRDGGNN